MAKWKVGTVGSVNFPGVDDPMGSPFSRKAVSRLSILSTQHRKLQERRQTRVCAPVQAAPSLKQRFVRAPGRLGGRSRGPRLPQRFLSPIPAETAPKIL